MWTGDLIGHSNFWFYLISCSLSTTLQVLSICFQAMAHLEIQGLTLWYNTGPCCCAACWSSSCQQLRRCVVASHQSFCWCTGVSAQVSRWVGAGRGLLPPVLNQCTSRGEAHEDLWGQWDVAKRLWQLGWSAEARKIKAFQKLDERWCSSQRWLQGRARSKTRTNVPNDLKQFIPSPTHAQHGFKP